MSTLKERNALLNKKIKDKANGLLLKTKRKYISFEVESLKSKT